MKKNLFFLLLLAIIAVSCQKDIVSNNAHSLDASPVKSAYDSQSFTQTTAESKAEEQRIEAFRNLLNDLTNTSSASPTSNEMAVDATVWNVEALLNASYASAGEPFASNSLKKDSISVPLNANGAIDESSLPSVYQIVRAKLGEQYRNVNGADKRLIFIDVALKGTRSSSNFANPIPMADLYVTSSIGYTPSLLPPGDIFGPNDNWRWAYEEGICNPATGTPTGISVGYDAAKLLGYALNTRYPKPLYRDYYTGVLEFSFSKIENPNDVTTIPAANRTPDNPTGKDNIRDYLTFSVSEQFPYDIPGQSNYYMKACIEAVDMNWYYQNYFNLITYQKNAFNKDFISAFVQGLIHAHIQPPLNIKHTELSHRLVITLGNYHRSGFCRPICMCDDDTCIPNCPIGSTF